MNSEIYIIGAIAAFSVIVAISYFFNPLFVKTLIGENDPFERKIFKGNLPFWQFLMITVFLPIIAVLITLLWNTINQRPIVHAYSFSERNTLWLIVLMLMMISYGEGAHAASVSIRHYMWKLTISKAFRVAEFYHHILSHFLTLLGIIAMFFLLAIHELSHPLLISINIWAIVIVVFAGICGGIVMSFAITEGRGVYYCFPALILSAAFLIFAVFDLELNIYFYPSVFLDLVLFTVTLITMVIWRMKNGSYKETVGEFFHQEG